MKISEAVSRGIPLRGTYSRGRRADMERDFLVLAIMRRLPPSGKKSKPGAIPTGAQAVLVYDPGAAHHNRPFSTCELSDLRVMAVLRGPGAEQIAAAGRNWWRAYGHVVPAGFEKEWGLGEGPVPSNEYLARDVPEIHV